MKINNNLGIYIHIPYCVKKCRYCDFVSMPYKGKEDEAKIYFEKLCKDIKKAGELYASQFIVDSIFFGGGTPSLLNEKWLLNVLEQIAASFSLSNELEISLEANPGTLTKEKLKSYKAGGFNRISLGIQSLNDEVLKAMGRIHTAKEALFSLFLAQNEFDNVNADLMMGVPFQTEKIWQDTLLRIINEKPSHISFYSLQLEEGTPFYNDYKKGLLELPSWQENRKMYHNAIYLLKNSGYIHYEISNAALLKKECLHNLKYWTMQPYLGFGIAASSFIAGQRFDNWEFPKISDEKLALQKSKDFSSFATEKKNDLKGDFIFTQLRLIEGLSLELYKELFKADFESDFKKALSFLLEENLLIKNKNHIYFSEKGLDKTNPIMEKLLECLE